jgi:hypothetical protein
MNKFSAERFYRIGCHLGNTIQAFEALLRYGASFQNFTAAHFVRNLRNIAGECKAISLKQSAKYAEVIIAEIIAGENEPAEVKVKTEALQKIISGEMEECLFLWVPSHRAEFYSKDAEAMVGAKCCARFKSVHRELEEAAKCYAMGRYTSSAFHLMRSTEAGVKALARAIKFTPPHDQWDLVFKQMKKEFFLKPSLRPAHWQTHGDFLEMVWADLRAVSKAWRNNIAHLVDTYSEEEAKNLLTVIPMFLRDLATKMNEKGKLY